MAQLFDRIGVAVLGSLWEGILAGALGAALLALLPARARAWRMRVLFATLACVALLPFARLATVLPVLEVPAKVVQPWIDPWSVGRSLARVLAVVAGLWLVGAAVALLRLVHAVAAAGRLRRATLPAPAELSRTVAELARQLGCRVPEVRWTIGSPLASPAVIGVLRPMIVVPANLHALADARLRTLLAHEVAHIARRDPLAALLQALLEAIAFHHPVVRVLGHMLRREREYDCDDRAVAICGSAHEHAHALIDLAERRAMALPARAVLAHALHAHAGRALRCRLERLFDGERRAARAAAQSMLVAAVLALAGGAGVLIGSPSTRIGAGLRALGATPWAEIYGDSLVRVLPEIAVDASALPGVASEGGALIVARGRQLHVGGSRAVTGQRVSASEDVRVSADGVTLRFRVEPSPSGRARLRVE